MKYDPNFPADLAITPSHHSQLSSTLSEDANIFGCSAQLESIQKYGIAGRVWEASYPLLLYLGSSDWEFDPQCVDDKSKSPLAILELGAGTGIVTSRILEMVADGARDVVISTDLPEVCPLLEANLKGLLGESNQRSDGLFIRPLAWGNRDHAIRILEDLQRSAISEQKPQCKPWLTHVVCSDLVYFPELLAPLLRTLIQLTSPPFISLPASGKPWTAPKVVISYKIRSLAKETPFWSAFGLWFAFEPVMARRIVKEDEPRHSWARFGLSFDDHTFVFTARRRDESLTWQVPDDDRNLMGGIGAWGTETRKGDDTFETLLLMSIQEDEDEDE